ncbi:MAG: hypothetical protein NC320_11295 [Clostridium sp.]|nr:hypothetical protein [Clostridium sp.]
MTDSIDISNYSKIRFYSSCDCESKYAIGDININGIAPSKSSEIPVYQTPEEFINSHFSGWRSSYYDDSDPVEAANRAKFKMNGRTYYQGIVLGDGSYYDGSSASFNVENVNSITFTLGHVDNTSKDSTKISIYCDDILIKQYDIE